MTWGTVASKIEFKRVGSSWGNGELGYPPLSPFSATEEARILSYLSAMYEGSSDARRVLDEGTAAGTIRIGESPPEYPAYNPDLNSSISYIAINLSQIDNIYIFNTHGELTKARPETVLIHEIFHFVDRLSDPDVPPDSKSSYVGGPSFDYRGPAVEFENAVNHQMGWNDKIRASYFTITKDSDLYNNFLVDASYTDGSEIDIVRVGNNESDLLDLSPRGDNSRDLLFGLGSLDVLLGGGGNDFLYGGDGDDILTGGSGSDHIHGDAGTDTAIFESGQVDYRLSREVGSGTYLVEHLASGQIDRLFGIEMLKFGSADATPIDSFDWLEGSTAPMSPSVPHISSPSSFTWIGTSTADSFEGTGGEDVVAGLGGDDDLSGQGDDDSLMGDGGEDTLNGGSGDDLLIGDDPGDLFADNLIGGAGNDTLVFYGAPSDTTDTGDGGSGHDTAYVDLSDRTREWQLTDNDGDVHLQLRSGDSEGDIKLKNFEVIAVFFGDDDDFAHVQDEQAYLEGRDGSDQLSSEDKNDYLDGGDGDDKLDAGTGVDWIDGGSGNDRAEVDLSDEDRDLTFVAASAASSSGFTFENGTHLRDIERIELVTGSGDDRIWLGDDVDIVDTRNGDDYVYTELWGQDSVDGGSGYDRLVVDLSHTSDRLRSSFDSSENDFEIYTGTQFGSATRRVHAMDFEEINLLGGSANDTLRGGKGDDDLLGNDGDDNLSGNDGNDRLDGGAGDDDLDVGRGVDWADGGSGDDYGSLDKGDSHLSFRFDTFQAATSAGETLADGTLVRNIERWDLWFGSGNDTVVTDIRTSRFADMGGGDDSLIIDHRGQGSALIGLAGSEFDQEYLASVGNDFASAVDNLRVWKVEHVAIYGGSGFDRIAGLQGSDILDGGAGADVMTGGSGDDIYFVDNSQDQVIETATGGQDTVYASISYALVPAAAVEVITTTNANGTATINLTGNELGNAIYGNAGANVLDGGGGSDLLVGGAGNDILKGGAGNDRLFGGDGSDIFAFATLGGSRGFAYRSDGIKLAPDFIGDFARGQDKIDLSAIDAVSGTSANDAFTFIGTNAFSHRAGELRYEAGNGQIQISADVDGDGFADMHILAAATAIQASDFVL